MTPGAVIAVTAYGIVVGWLVHSVVDIRREKRAEEDERQAENRLMAFVLFAADEEWDAEDETDAAFCRTLEEIQALEVADPWTVADE